jgi:hypothetical protein
MRSLRPLLLAVTLLGTVFALPATVHAAEATKERGLLISPIRSYEALDAGDTKTRSVTVANMTNKPIVVTMSLEQFSVADYVYDYRFSQPKNNYVRLVENRIELKPFESHAVPYVIDLPATAAPGGEYYTFFASATLGSGTLNGTVRAASLLYLTVNGDLIQTGDVVKSSIPWVIFTPQIPYTIDIKNTGNVHYFANFTGSVAGAFYNSSPTGTSQLLMPKTTRRITGTVTSPLLPGVYKLNFGYTTDSGAKVSRSQYFLFLPPWFLVLLAVAGYVFGKRYIKRRSARAETKKEPTDS